MDEPLIEERFRPKYTEAELAELVKELTNGHAKPGLVRRAILHGKIRPFRVGHRSLYCDQDAVEFVQSLKVAPDAKTTEPQAV